MVTNIPFAKQIYYYYYYYYCTIYTGNKIVISLLRQNTFVVNMLLPWFTEVAFRFSSTTNTTQILEARKQMEYENNEY